MFLFFHNLKLDVLKSVLILGAIFFLKFIENYTQYNMQYNTV